MQFGGLYDGARLHLMWKGASRKCPRCQKEDFDLVINAQNKQLAQACTAAAAQPVPGPCTTRAGQSQYMMGCHRMCPVCLRSFQLRLAVKGENVQAGIDGTINVNNLPYNLCPGCTQDRITRSNSAGPSTSSQATPATPVKSEPGTTPPAEPSTTPLYQAHSSGPGVLDGLKFHQRVHQLAGIAHASQGSCSNPITIPDDGIDNLLQDPLVMSGIDKVVNAFYEANPEVAAKFIKTPVSGSTAADQVLPAAKILKTTPEGCASSVAAAAAAAGAGAAAVGHDQDEVPPTGAAGHSINAVNAEPADSGCQK